MDDIIYYLQGIQDNLVGIIFPAVITAFLTLLTLIVNTILQVNLSNRQYKSKQFEIMRDLYPQIKSLLINIVCYYNNLMNNALYKNNFLVIDYVNHNWTKFRQNLSNEEIMHVDDYIKNINCLINGFKELNIIFEKNNIPTTNKRIQKDLNDFQIFCAYIKNCSNGVCGGKYKNYNKKEIENLIKICDKHYNKF